MNCKEIHKLWLNSSEISEEEKKILFSLSQKEIKKYFKNKKLNFGTGGIREIVGLGTVRLNRFTCSEIFQAYAKFLTKKYKNPSVVVFYDNRKNSQEFSLIAASILKKSGINVYVSPKDQILSTPFLSYTIRKLNLTGGINITASHNSIKYNGIKIYGHLGKQLLKNEEEEIISYIPKTHKLSKIEKYKYCEFKEIDTQILEDYFKQIKNHTPSIGKNKSFGALFSSHHGTTSKLMKQMAHNMGFKNFIEYEKECNVTWKINSGEIINPEIPDSFKESIKEAEKLKISYVFASDPDGDRSSFVEKQKDGSWYFFNGNEIGIISAYFKYQNQTIINPYIVTTHVTGEFIKKIFPNIPIHIVPTGFKNISEKIEKEESSGNNLLIAFEESIGSIISPIHREKDGFQQIALILEIISHLKDINMTVREYLESLFKRFGYWSGFTDSYKVSKKIMKKINSIDLDLIKKKKTYKKLGIIEWKLSNENWIKFRYSGTEPKLKIYYNIFGENKKQIEEECKKFQNLFSEIIKKN